MTGKIQIYNTKVNSGKVILDDGRESSIVNFPASFESGDKVEVKFRNNDPEQAIINIIVPGDEWHFGFVQIPHGERFDRKTQLKRNRPFGNILPTYPAVGDLLFYHSSDLNFEPPEQFYNAPVKFKIRKTQDGKVKAVDISEVVKKDIFKCRQPKFGKLDVKQERTKTGFIKDVVNDKNYQTISGKIVHLSIPSDSGYQFGFIQREDKPNKSDNVFFNVNLFRNFKKREPNLGDEVNFDISTDLQGRTRVNELKDIKEKEVLPRKQQYCTIEDNDREYKIPLQEYEDFYNRAAEVGDIVYYNVEGKDVVLKNDDSEVIEKITMKKDEQYSESGKVTMSHHDGFYGFIENENCSKIFFLQGDYKKVYGKKPQAGDSVRIQTKSTSKGIQVSKFISDAISDSEVTCPKSTFKNFVEVEPNALYYVYSSDNRIAAEVRKFNPNLKSEAISCYKDKNLKGEHRLKAIETLININHEDNKITQNKLLKEKRGILTQLLENELSKENFQNALSLEFQLQEMDYNPTRLNQFAQLSKLFEIDLNKVNEIEEIAFTDQWMTCLDKFKDVEELAVTDKYLININESIEVISIKNTMNWNIDLTPPKEIKPIYGLEEERFIHIDK